MRAASAEPGAPRPLGGEKPDPTSTETTPLRARPRSPRPVPIAIIDPNPLLRAGLVSTLSSRRDGFRVVAGCSALEDLSEKAAGTCKLMLLGIAERVGPILSQIKALAERGIRVVVLAERVEANEVFAAVAAGADGFLLKNEIGSDALVASLELVLLGGLVIPRVLSNRRDQMPRGAMPMRSVAADPIVGDESNAYRAPALSDREQAILEQLKRGASNKQIARELDMAEATVKVHVKNVLQKLRVQNRTQAAMWAVQNATRVT